MIRCVTALLILFALASSPADAGIHRAPIIIQGLKLSQIARYPISMYRVFRTGPAGEAVPIPFQIDEINDIGDYVLDQGATVNANTGNGLFDLQDELVFMGDDVGPVRAPTRWDFKRPGQLFELKHTFADAKQEGAIYIGLYFDRPPPLVERKYVVFNPQKGEISTSRYRYEFDKKNYLVVNGVDMVKGQAEKQETKVFLPLLDSSTFYMKADMKYFVTVEANHRSINSKLEAFKTGPVRSIVRVIFFYSILKLNFEIGMYTEVSFFSNSVNLPAIMYNPLDGTKSLNDGSGFYYGFAVNDNLRNYNVATNMVRYEAPSLLNYFKANPKVETNYWISATAADRMMYVEIAPSQAMLDRRNIPLLYTEDVNGAALASRQSELPRPLTKSPVNLALYFDLTKFTEGEHHLSFKLFFENRFDPLILQGFRDLNKWQLDLTRL